MAVVTLDEVKHQLNLEGLGLADDALLGDKIAAAQNHIERLLGYAIEEKYPPTGDEPPISTVPAALKEAVLQLAAFWYEHRGTGLLDGSDIFKALPFDIDAIVTEFREWSF